MKKPDASAFRLISIARNTHEFQTIRSEGGLPPPDLPRRVIDPKANLPGTKPEDYGLPQGEQVNEAITQSWNRMPPPLGRVPRRGQGSARKRTGHRLDQRQVERAAAPRTGVRSVANQLGGDADIQLHA